ncbi:MAG TPA: hypothetical protein VKA76_12215 [Gammaproteobacteria bacterium]|nr:hypothetical protein [Gammaproteobacteria bacterium]
MDPISLVVMAVMAGGLALTAVALARAIKANLLRGQLVRVAMARRLDRLPLKGLLALVGTDVRHFLHSRYLHAIEGGLRACEACGEQDRCRHCLQSGSALGGFDFCPNYALLSRPVQTAG